MIIAKIKARYSVHSLNNHAGIMSGSEAFNGVLAFL